jgi:hypothetical protein
MGARNFWVLKRDSEHHYFRVESGTFVPRSTAATRFDSRDSAREIARWFKKNAAYGLRVVLVRLKSPAARKERSRIVRYLRTFTSGSVWPLNVADWIESGKHLAPKVQS